MDVGEWGEAWREKRAREANFRLSGRRRFLHVWRSCLCSLGVLLPRALPSSWHPSFTNRPFPLPFPLPRRTELTAQMHEGWLAVCQTVDRLRLPPPPPHPSHAAPGHGRSLRPPQSPPEATEPHPPTHEAVHPLALLPGLPRSPPLPRHDRFTFSPFALIPRPDQALAPIAPAAPAAAVAAPAAPAAAPAASAAAASSPRRTGFLSAFRRAPLRAHPPSHPASHPPSHPPSHPASQPPSPAWPGGSLLPRDVFELMRVPRQQVASATAWYVPPLRYLSYSLSPPPPHGAHLPSGISPTPFLLPTARCAPPLRYLFVSLCSDSRSRHPI